MAIPHDIDSSRLTEDAVFRTIFEMAPDVIYRIAPDATLAALSPAFESLTGWAVEDWLGKPFAGMVHPDDLPLAAERFEQTMRGETPPPYELRVRSRSGEYLVGEFRTRPQIENGVVVGKIGVARDITERKRVESALRFLAEENSRLYQQAQEALRLREEFLSIASHELKTPLAALQLQMGMMARAVRAISPDEPSAERMTRTIESADRQVKRLTKLIGELLDVSRIAAGRLELDREEMDLAFLVREVAARFEDDQTDDGSPITVCADTPVVGRWDRFRLDQVVTNLLSNAVKYGDGKPIQVTVGTDGAAARLVVCDQGIGIAPQDLSRIFDRFERAAPAGVATSARPHSGLGLGLYICRRLVEAHGGSITVTSEVGAGSSFTVELPLTTT